MAQRWAWSWPALVFAAAVAVLTAAPEALLAQAALRPEVLASGRLWPLWTGHLVHWGVWHAMADAVGVAGCGLLACALYGPVRVTWVLLAAAPVLSLGVLALQPELASYRGASGLVVGLGAMAWVGLWRTAAVPRRWLVPVALALSVKLAVAGYTAAHGLPVAGFGLPEGVTAAWSAHALGALVGLVAGALMRPVEAFRTAPGPRTPAPHR